MYLFEWESPLIGAPHGLDMMMWGNREPMLSVLAALSDYDSTSSFMRKAWTRFAADGSPASPATPWPTYTDERATMSISNTPALLAKRFGAESELFLPLLSGNWSEMGL